MRDLCVKYVIAELMCTSVKTENVEKLTNGFKDLLFLAVEI